VILFSTDFLFEIFGQHFNSFLKVSLIVFEYHKLLSVLVIESEDIGIHKSLSTTAQHVDRLFHELDLNPRHIELVLHLKHFGFDAAIDFRI
jgi:hypothetical protein